MLRGLATLTLTAEDVSAAARWYAELVGVDPYFRRPDQGPPAYVEFRVGDLQQELGVVDRRYAPHLATPGPGGACAYWHVDDLPAALDRLVARGARPLEPLTDRGHGFVTASVVDPFGNVLGVMTNPHYLEVLAARPA